MWRVAQIVGLASLMSALVFSQMRVGGASDSLLQDAGKAITAGDFDRAENDLQSALRLSPDNPQALDILGMLRAQQQRNHEAEEIFQRIIKRQPEFMSAHVHLGFLYIQMGRADDAVRELQEGLRLAPDRSDAANALVSIWRQEAQASLAGDPEKALSLLLQARKIAPDDPDVQFEFGMVALRMQLLPDAVSAFQKTLDLKPSDFRARYGLGRALMEQTKFEDARREFVEYLSQKPDDASGHYALGMSFAALQRSEDARREFEKSISLAPVQTESYFRLGVLDVDSRQLESAEKNFRRVLERNPKHAGALAGLGRVKLEQKNYEESLDLLEQAVAADDGLREAHYYLGLAYARVGRKQESEDQLQIAARLEHEEAEKQRTVFTILNPDSASGAPASK